LNRDRALPFLLPYALYVAVPVDWLGRTPAYAVRLVVVTLAVLLVGRRYLPLRGPRAATLSVLIGAATGAVGCGIWIVLVRPLAPANAAAWSDASFALRLVAAGALVPVVEEQLLRGFVLRFVVQWQEARRAGATDALGVALDRRSVNDVRPGAATPLAVAVSTVAFAAGHAVHEMPAAAVYGLLMAALWIVRRDLLSCVVAHAVTNVALAFYVRGTGDWLLW
jgi:hypothetical protein